MMPLPLRMCSQHHTVGATKPDSDSNRALHVHRLRHYDHRADRWSLYQPQRYIGRITCSRCTPRISAQVRTQHTVPCMLHKVSANRIWLRSQSMIRAPFELNESSLQSAVCICSDRTVFGPAANEIKPQSSHLSANYFCHSDSFVTYRSI